VLSAIATLHERVPINVSATTQCGDPRPGKIAYIGIYDVTRATITSVTTRRELTDPPPFIFFHSLRKGAEPEASAAECLTGSYYGVTKKL
jgi:hypothetical protein